jgi:hypothetical protein
MGMRKEGRIAGMPAKMETNVTRVNGRWVLQFKTEIMTTPAFWHYNTEQEATAAEQRLNPPVHRVQVDAYCA